MASRLRALLGEPLLHFLLVGAALMALYRWRHPASSATPPTLPAHAAVLPAQQPAAARTIVVDDDIRGQLRDSFTRAQGRAPTDDELAGAVDRWVNDEILYREGLARGLDRDDPSVRSRVADKMAFVLRRQVIVPEPGDAELHAWFAAHPSHWGEPERIDFTQVFVDGRDAAAEQRASGLLAQLSAGADPGGLGDSFSGGRRYRGRKPADLARTFGAEFVDGLDSQPPGSWALRRSRFGLHLVRVDRHSAAHAVDFATVRLDVRKEWRDDRRARAVDAEVARLRSGWTVTR